METLLVALIVHVRQAIPMLVRTAADKADALDGVLSRGDVTRCCELLEKALGEPLKPFGDDSALPSDVQAWVNRIGGIRKDQCLFVRRGAGKDIMYAALWPWASDPTKVTLKVGRAAL